MTATVADCMVKDVLSLTPEMTLREAAAALARRRISGAPVLGPKREVLGVLSEADLIRFFSVSGRPQSPLVWLEELAAIDAAKEKVLTVPMVLAMSAKVKEAMTKEVLTVVPSTTVDEATLLMGQNDVNRLPVVDGGRLVGLVTRGDLIRHLAGTAAFAAPVKLHDKGASFVPEAPIRARS